MRPSATAALSPLGPSRHPFGLNPGAFGLNSHPFGPSRHPFGLNPGAFGLNSHPFGLSRHAFGLSPRAFGLSRHAFGLNRPPVRAEPVEAQGSHMRVGQGS